MTTMNYDNTYSKPSCFLSGDDFSRERTVPNQVYLQSNYVAPVQQTYNYSKN